MTIDAGTAERRESGRSGGPRVSAFGAALGLVQLAAVIALSAFTAGSSSSPSQLPAGSSGRAVAYVNGTAITSDRLDLAVNALIPQESFHRAVKPERIAELRQKALETLVDDELQYQAAERRGLTASSRDVTAGLGEVTARYATPGAYLSALRRAHLTNADVRREVQRTVMIRKARDAFVTSQCGVGAAEAERYFDAHRERFVVPEELHIQAITIGVEPSSPPSAWPAAKARAEQVRRRLIDGAAFEAMVGQYSTDSTRDKGGDMGYFHRGSLADEFERATSRLRPGQISDVVQTIYGYHVVRIVDVRPSRQKTFAEVSGELQKDLTSRRCAELNDAWLGQLRAGATVTFVAEAVDRTPPPAPRGGLR